MKADEIIEKLSQEKKSGARFPARIIFTENLSSYAQLVNKLKSACDLTVNISDFADKVKCRKTVASLMRYGFSVQNIKNALVILKNE